MSQAARYQQSNKVIWAKVPALIAGCIIASLTVAFVLAFLQSMGWYLIILLPILAAVLLGKLVQLLLAFAKCRNGLLAASVGFLSGALCFLGIPYFVIAIATRSLPNPVHIVGMVQFMIDNTVVEDKKGRNQANQPNPIENSLLMLFEVSAMSITSAAMAWQQSRRVYCERCDSWAVQENCFLQPGLGVVLAAALREQKLNEFVPTAIVEADPQKAAKVTLEYCGANKGKSVIDCPMYLSVKDPASSRQVIYVKPTIQQEQLEPDEILDLLPLYPRLSQTLNHQHGQLVDQSALNDASQTSSTHTTTKYATAQEVDLKPQDKLINLWYKLAINLIPGTPLLGAISSGALATYLATREYYTAAIALGIVCGIFCLLCVYAFSLGMSVMESKWTVRKFEQLIKRREDALGWVNDANKRLVALIGPGGLAATSAFAFSDILWFKFDEADKSIRMLGDNHNYHIPSESIVSVDCQGTSLHGQVEIWSVRLDIQFVDARKQLLMLLANPKFGIYTNARRHRNAEAFATEIKQFCQRHQPAPVVLASTLGT